MRMMSKLFLGLQYLFLSLIFVQFYVIIAFQYKKTRYLNLAVIHHCHAMDWVFIHPIHDICNVFLKFT